MSYVKVTIFVTALMYFCAGSQVDSQASLYGPRCLSCREVSDPATCNKTVQCWASQQCYSERFIHTDGIVRHNFGCKIQDECDLINAKNIGQLNKRLDIVIDLCEQCCHGDLCNVNHCINSTETSLSCYECENEGNPNDCHSLKRCATDQVCYAEKVISDSPHPKHSLGCIPKVICQYLKSPPLAVGKRYLFGSRGKRDTHLCQKCCHDSGCNADLCNTEEATVEVNTLVSTELNFSPTSSIPMTTETTHHFFPSSVSLMYTQTATTPESSHIRLVNGRTANEGTVEINNNGQWGTICDDYFDHNTAKVICRMLGYPEDTITHSLAWAKAHFGSGTGPIWLDDVKCTGNETTIYDCTHKPFGSNDCSKTEDAGVNCYVPSCPAGFRPNGESCFSITVDKVETLDAAKIECAKKHATVASVDSTMKRDYLVTELKTRINADVGEWLTGGHKVGGRWIWEGTGQPIDNSVLVWGPGQPHSDLCLSIWGPSGMKYADVVCEGSPRNYICEKQLR